MSVIVVLLDPKLAPKPENEPAPMQTEPVEAS
jgi:hypothetical protein